MNAVSAAMRISPKLVTDNMEATITFYQDVLGFTPVRRSPEYLILERDSQAIHVGVAASEEVMRRLRGHTEMSIEVAGVHALWEHVKTFKDRYRIRDLFDREYGVTEFHIVDPNEYPVFVGEPTST